MIQKIKKALDIYIQNGQKIDIGKEGNNLNLVAFQPMATSKVRWQNI